MSSPILTVDNLTIGFGRSAEQAPAVRNLSYYLNANETLAIVGESGSGKSVSSMALLGLLPQGTSRILNGTAMFDGRDLLHLGEEDQRTIRGKRISMIFQEPMTSLNPVLTIGRQMTEVVQAHDPGAANVEKLAVTMLDRVRLPDPSGMMKRYPHQLSGGQRQRVMIAMALINRPEILIADEPTTALDVTVQAQILELMRELKDQFGTSMLLITHDMGVVAETADRVIVMKQGERVEEGTVTGLFENPTHSYTRKLLAAVPKIGTSDVPPKADATAGSRAPVVEAKDLNKTFRSKGHDVHALNEVSFSIPPGETLALVGESGSGKSTAARAILRLMEVDSGEILMDGQDIRQFGTQLLRKSRKQMQMIFQDPYGALDPRMRVDRLVAEPMRIHNIASGRELQDRTEALFRQVGLTADQMRRYPHEFSGGQRQRLCIARALGVEPKLIVADEPTSALDVSIQAQVIELMLDLQQRLGLSYLFISHDLAVVEQMSHSIAVMLHGRIVEVGPRDAVLKTPAHAYTRELLNAIPIPDPQRTRGKLTVTDRSAFSKGPLLPVSEFHLAAS
ncbi:ABC transporter ATP-binding protein [Roseibium aggregatum]|uniref:ABC transporter ATP-binding protein n=1 Tax=Roseibium aggregatum TaxID=187304 RepID=A0A939EI49_9HYPH|nr:ABC transporter ATP-binding protein [Roseibium aggregatum]MBN9672160.1 ABC transporter ATP-binding protein [Roseibium aggregatum]